MPQLPPLVAHWKLAGDARDCAGDHHGEPRSVSYTTGPNGEANGAALFNGLGSAVVVPDSPALRFGCRDFTITARIKCPKPMTSVFGDVLSKFDPVSRCGVNLTVAGSSPAYNGMSDTRHVHFGIDDGYVGPWEDYGRPWPSNALVTCLIVFEGALYAGIAEAADPMDACKVFRWDGGQEWVDCGRLGRDPNHLSVQSMIVHEGRLYAGTGIWDWTRAYGERAGCPPAARTRVFVYEGGTEWRDLGQVGAGSRVIAMGSFRGELFAGIDRAGGGHCFRYDGRQWHDCGAPDGRNVESFMPLGGRLHVATHGNVYVYEGDNRWLSIAQCPHNINQIHSLQVAGGKLWAGAWPQGYALRWECGTEWAITGRLGIPEGLRECNEINSLIVHNGKLYAGVIPKAQVWRYEHDGCWTLLARLATRPDYHDEAFSSWMRVTCITSFQGKLFACTGSCEGRSVDVDPEATLGRVYALQTGQMVSHECDVGGEWTHVAAVREGKTLRLYVNGRLSASSVAPPGQTFDLTNTRPLLIGSGAQASFSGAMADVKVYGGAVDESNLKEVFSAPSAPLR